MPDSTAQWDGIYAQIEAMGAGTVRVGIVGPSASEMVPGTNLTILDIGLIHELGSRDGRVPERSYLRSTLTEHRTAELAELQRKLARAIVERGMAVRQALGILGESAVSWVKETIRSRKTTGPGPQANKPATIKRKGSDVPLVDTAQLINSISYEIEE